MTIKELIASKLRPIGDAIREKDGSTELITIDDMPQAIRDIKGGGLIEVTELPEVGKANTVYKLVNKIGTAIPTTGTIENYYLNVSLSINKVVDILSQLTYQSGTDANTNVVFQTDNHNIICYQVDGAYAIKADNAYVFASNLTLAERLQCSSIGWNVAFITEDWTPKTPVAVNETILTEEDLGMPIGAENDKVINLFSITPFEEKIPSEMYYLFENSEWQQISGGILEVNNLPTSGEDNYVYKLSQQPTYEPYINMEGLGVVSLKDIAQQNGATVEIVDIVDSKDQLPTENIKEITSDSVMYVYYVRNDNYYMYGPFSDDGSKIWFSLTEYFEGMPFKGEVTNTSEMTELNSLYTLVSGGEGVDYYMYENSVPTQVPNSGWIENLYFNTKLSIEETDAILSQLTFNDDGEYMIMVYQNVDGTYGSVGVLEANKTTQGQISSGYMIYNLPNASGSITSMEVIYTSSEDIVAFAESVGLTATVGWNKDNLSVSKEAIDGNRLENDKLINVISTTPYPRWTKISGGGATVKATPEVVPNTGFVERVYLNKSLTFDEVNAICTKANNLVANELVPIYCVVSNDTFDKQLSTFKLTDHDGTTFNSIHYPNLGNVIWSERDYYNEEKDGSITQFKKGWMFEEDYVEINSEVVSFIEGDFAVNVGQHNDQLTELFSANGTFVSEMKLDGEYDGTTIFLSNKIVSEPTVVPNSGTVEKVYFNTNLSVEEVVSLISGLIYYTLENQPITYSILASSDWLHTLNITNENGNYTILKYNRETNDLTIIWTNYEYSGDNLSGWREVAKNAISFECEVTNTGGTFDVGAENDKLANLISITPFEVKTVNNFNIDIKSMLEEKKLPLAINVNVEPNLQEKEVTENGEYVADEGYDGFSKVTVNVKGVELNPVTNIALNSSGLLTWDAPDTTDIADKLVSISYVINFNGTELTSDTNSVNVKSSLVEGDNTVSVKAIVSLYNEETQSVVEYEIPQVEVITLSATMPKTTHSSPVASYQKTLYVFNVDHSNMICKFDTATETVTTLSATTTPNMNYGGCAKTIGTNIYIFGGNNSSTICKFDTATETVTTLSATMPNTAYWFACNVDKLIYLLSGNGTYICKFDTETETVTTLDINNSSKRNVCCNINNKIYWIDGYTSTLKSKMYKFDTETETISDLGEKFTFAIGGPNTYASIANDKEMYIFGYGNSITIYKFDTETETVTTLDVTLNYSKYDISCGVVNKTIYLIGGRYPAVNTIMKITNLI